MFIRRYIFSFYTMFVINLQNKNLKTTFILQVRPHLDMTFANVLAHINTVYVLKTKSEEMRVVDPHEEIASLRLKVGFFCEIV